MTESLYLATNEVLEALGGKWNKKAKAHLFDGDAADLVEETVLTGTFTKTKQDFGFFETPLKVVELMWEVADLNSNSIILEPEAGRGAIAVPTLLKYHPKAMTCFELQERNIDKLDERVCNATCEWTTRDDFPVINADFLATTPKPTFTHVLMNPPFSRRADIHHIRHAFKFLRPKGRLVAIASASVLFRTDALATDFRAFIDAHNGHIEGLPEASFKESGTMVNTVLIHLSA